MIFGLTAALGGWMADFGAAVMARRVGTMTTLVFSQAAGILTLLVMAAVLRPDWSTPPGVIAGMAANGLIAAGAYLLLYRGLELGPVALVSQSSRPTRSSRSPSP